MEAHAYREPVPPWNDGVCWIDPGSWTKYKKIFIMYFPINMIFQLRNDYHEKNIKLSLRFIFKYFMFYFLLVFFFPFFLPPTPQFSFYIVCPSNLCEIWIWICHCLEIVLLWRDSVQASHPLLLLWSSPSAPEELTIFSFLLKQCEYRTYYQPLLSSRGHCALFNGKFGTKSWTSDMDIEIKF